MSFMLALFLVGAAGAQEADSPTPSALDLDGTIVKVPGGSTVTVKNEDGSFTLYGVPAKYWLMPDSYYREAVIQGKQLKICQPALDRCTETALDWQDRTYTALNQCSEQFDSDEALINDLTVQVTQLETRALVAETALSEARRQKWVAWAVTGGLVLGAVTVTTVTLEP